MIEIRERDERGRERRLFCYAEKIREARGLISKR